MSDPCSARFRRRCRVDARQMVHLLFGVVVLLGEPLIEDVVIRFVEVAPQHDYPLAIGTRAFHNTHASKHVNVLDGRTQEPVEWYSLIAAIRSSS